jgi:hydroxypyruvate isomerase
MPRFAANTSFLFTEVDFLQRFDAARKSGFAAVEFPFPYPHERSRLQDAVQKAGVEVALFNLPAGDWTRGERGIACHPGREGEFQDGVGAAIEYARLLHVPKINCLSGIAPPDADPDQVLTTFVENLGFAAEQLAQEGRLLVMEPINTRTIPGFYLNTSAQSLDILREVGSGNLKIQYDIFHMQIMEGDLAKTIEAELPQIGHIQFADVPDRHEPGSGEINFDFLFERIDALGYDGWIGAEYAPAKSTLEGLGWLAKYSRPQR